jgi:hypothetical protein
MNQNHLQKTILKPTFNPKVQSENLPRNQSKQPQTESLIKASVERTNKARTDIASQNDNCHSDDSELSDILPEDVLEKLKQEAQDASNIGSAGSQPAKEYKGVTRRPRYLVPDRELEELGGDFYKGPPPIRKAAQRGAGQKSMGIKSGNTGIWEEGGCV